MELDAARIGGSTPSYQYGLALIGQYFNQQNARMITIAEVDSGFLLFFFPNGDLRKPRSLAVHHTDLLELKGPFAGASPGKGALLRGGDSRDKRHPLCPQGYDVMLRALGYKMDRRSAVGLTLCETPDKLYVDYWVDKATFVIKEQRRQAISSEQSDIFTPASLAKLLESIEQTRAQEMSRYEHGLRLNHHDYNSTLRAAYLVEDQGDYRHAESLFNHLIKQVPDHPEAHYHAARIAIARGDRRAALIAGSKAAEIRGESAAAHDLHGRALQQNNKPKEALAAIQRAIEIDPHNGIFYYHLAKIHEALGQKEEAEEAMAHSASQHAAPAWDMVQEEIATGPSDAVPAAGQPYERADDSPAASALLPQLADDRSASPPPAFPDGWGQIPSMTDAQPAGGYTPQLTTEFGAGGPADWPPQATTPTIPIASPPPTPAAPIPTAPLAAQSAAPPAPWAGGPMPQLTPFPAEPAAPPAWPAAPQAQAQQPWPTTPQPQTQAAWPPAPQQQSQPVWPAMPQPQQPQSSDVPTATLEQRMQAATAAPIPAAEPYQPQAPMPAAMPAFPPAAQYAGVATPQVQQPDPAPRLDQGWPPQAGTAPTSPAASALYPGLETTQPTIRNQTNAAPAPHIAATTPQSVPSPASSAAFQPSRDATPPADLPPPGGSQETSPQPIEMPLQPAAGGKPDATTPNAVELAAEIMMIQRALESEPNRADLHRKLGFLLARQGRTAEAATEFRKALQCSRTNL